MTLFQPSCGGFPQTINLIAPLSFKKKSLMLSVTPKLLVGSRLCLHEITMDHVTQYMPTDYPFKGSMTESSRQTQCKTMGTLREGGLGNDLFKYMWVHPFTLMVTRILFVSWKLTVRPIPPKCQAKQLVACTFLFRQSLPSAVLQSEQRAKANSVL